MMNFIYACMAFLVISFIGVPIYKGISSEHEKITTIANANDVEKDNSLSFEEIYALADDSAPNNPAFLNDIIPAAGGNNPSDTFSSGFRSQEDSALAMPEAIITEEKSGS